MRTHYKNKKYKFDYISAKDQYEIKEISPLLEMKRFKIVNYLKKKINNYFVKNNIKVDVINILARWLMTNISLAELKVDPLIPIYPSYYDQIIKDINILSKKRISLESSKNIIKTISLDKECFKSLKIIKNFKNSNLFTKYNKLLEIEKKYINSKFMILKIKYNNHLEKEYININRINTLHIKFNINLYNKLLKIYNINTGKDINFKPDKVFDKLCFCIASRYYTLESYNQQLAVVGSFYEILRQKFNIDFELFASPFNHYYNNYCSLYSDIEEIFNSKGQFNHINLEKGFYVANPPFDNYIMENMSNKLINFLDNSNEELGFVITIPAWDKNEKLYGKYKTLDILKNKKYLKYIRKIPKNKALFVDYITEKIIYPTDVYVIVLQNENLYDKYPISKELFDKLIDDYWINIKKNDIQFGGKYKFSNNIKEFNNNNLKKINNIHTEIIIPKNKEIDIKKKIIINKKPPMNKIFKKFVKKNNEIHYLKNELKINKCEEYLSKILSYPYTYLFFFAYIEDYFKNNKCIKDQGVFDKNNNLRKKVKYRKGKYGKVPLMKDKKISVLNNFSNLSIYTTFELNFLLNKYITTNIDFLNNISIIDFTPLSNNSTYNFIKSRIKTQRNTLVSFLNKNKTNLANYYKITSITNTLDLVDIKEECNDLKGIDLLKKFYKKESDKYELIYISGSFEYFDLKKTKLINEFKVLHIFFHQIVYLLEIQKLNGCCIIYSLGSKSENMKKIIYMLSMFYEKVIITKIRNDTDVQYIICKNFVGINNKNKNTLELIFNKLGNKFLKYGENINIKDLELRKKLMITKKWENDNSNLFIHSLFDIKINKRLDDKINKFNNIILKKYLNIEYIKLDIIKLLRKKNNKKFINSINDEQIKKSIEFCIKHNININPLYLQI